MDRDKKDEIKEMILRSETATNIIKTVAYFIFASLVLVLVLQATKLNYEYYSFVFAIIALFVAILAVNIPETVRKKEKEAELIEKCLYNFYYPLLDYIERYSIEEMAEDKKDVEYIALYRRLAKEETKNRFEEFRNGNYKKDDGVNLLHILKEDVDKYEKRLEDLQITSVKL